jgi:hypothetical protein
MGVEVSGGLIREHELGTGPERPGDRDPLLLSARELPGAVLEAGHQLQRHHEVVDPLLLGARGLVAVELERQLDVAQHVQRGHEVEGLEHEADPAPAQQRQLRIRQFGDLTIAEPDTPGGRAVESGHDVHEGGLARTARAHDRGELAAAEPDRHVIERDDSGGSGSVGLGEVFDPRDESEVGWHDLHAAHARQRRSRPASCWRPIRVHLADDLLTIQSSRTLGGGSAPRG